MSLSDFGYDILHVLDEADGYISSEEIAQALPEWGKRILPKEHVRPYLEHALEEYVERRPPDHWSIASPHHGKFLSERRPVREDTTDHGPEETVSVEESQDELSRAIVQILADADTPLSGDRIARSIEVSGVAPSSEVEFIKTQVNRRLYYELSAVVEKDDDHRWRLTDRKYDETDETADEKDAEANRDLKVSSVDGGRATKGGKDGEEDTSLEDQSTGSRGGNQRAGEEDQEESSDEGTARESQDDLETSLSDFEREILMVLDREEGYLYTKDIVDALQRTHDRDSDLGRVQFYLENALDEFVVRKSSKGWNIASSYRGRFSKEEASDREGSPDSSEETGEVERLDSVDELSELVVQELSEADSALKARHIAERISEGSNNVSFSKINRIRTEVNRRLYGELSSCVEKDDEHWWTLKQGVQKTSSLASMGKSQGEGVGEDGDRPHPDEDTDDTSEHDDEEGELQKTTPAGIAAEVGKKLETAKQIVFLLDLADSPLSTSKITSLIQARGREVTEESIRQYLRSTLSRFVVEEQEGYRLREDPEGSVDPEIGRASPAEQTEEADSEQKPVDAVTRASVSGRQYNYEFESQEMEGSSLFTSQVRGGTVIIKLNVSHPAFDHFKHVLDGKGRSGEGQVEGRGQRLIRLLLVAWTEVEGDLSGRRSEIAEEIRDDWGRALRFLLRERDTE